MPIPSYLKNVLGNTNFLTGQPVNPTAVGSSGIPASVYSLPNNGGAINNGSIVPQSLYSIVQNAPSTPPQVSAPTPAIGQQQAITQASGPFANTPSGSYIPNSLTNDTTVTNGNQGVANPTDYTQNNPGNGYSNPNTQNPQGNSSFDPLQSYQNLALEQAMHSSQGTGLYALQPGVAYSPDQIMSQRKAADDIYNQKLNEYANLASDSIRRKNGGMTTVDENGNIIQGNQNSFDPLTIGRYNRAVNSATSILQKNPTFKNIIGSSAYLDRIEAAIKNPGSVGDQELLDAFTQLNTGGNRVTEAQVHLITNNQSFGDFFNKIQNKLATGGALSQDQRNEITKLSKEVYNNYQKSYKPLYDDTVSRLKEQGIPKQFWNIPSPDTLSRAVSDSATEVPSGNTSTATAGPVTWDNILDK